MKRPGEDAPQGMPGEADAPAAAQSERTGRPVPLHKVHQPSLTDVAVDQIRRTIVRGHVAPGERLDEPSICAALGISRTPVREALKLLAAEGLVELRRNRNPIVALVDAAELAHLFEVESGIESMAARLAAKRMTAAEIKQLESLQLRMERYRARRELDGYFEINQQIHKLVVGGAKNPVLAETHGWLLGRLERARYMALSAVGRWEQSVIEHREILAALKDGDAERAGSLFAVHVERTGVIVAKTVGELNRARAAATDRSEGERGE